MCKAVKSLSYVKLNDIFIDNDLYKIFNLSENEIKLINDIYNNDNISISSKSSTNKIILCGAPLKKKSETCKKKQILNVMVDVKDILFQ